MSSLLCFILISGVVASTRGSVADVLELNDPFDLPDGIRFDPGIWWYWGSWPCDADPMPAVHNGEGYLEVFGSGNWHNPALSTAGGAFYSIRDDIGIDYRIEYRLRVPQASPHYFGVYSWITGERSRGFLLREDGILALTTDTSGNGLSGPSAALKGIDTPVSYPVGVDFTLRLTLVTNGDLTWEINDGGGFRPVVPYSAPDNPASQQDLELIQSWPVGAGGAEIGAGFLSSHYMMIQCHGGSDTSGGEPAVILEDNFNDPAGDMSPRGVAENVSPAWRWNETGPPPNRYDGVGLLQMPMQGAWSQYIDEDFPGVSQGQSVAVIFVFTMPGSGGEALGFSRDGSWTSGGPTRLFKLRNGNIYLSNSAWSTSADLNTGQQYVSNAPQGLMILVDGSTGKTSLFYQNGSEKESNSDAWVNITPSSDPNGLLDFSFGPNKVGVNNYIASNGQNFAVDYIGLIQNPLIPGEEPQQNGPQPDLYLDRVTVVTSAPSGSQARDGVRVGPWLGTTPMTAPPQPQLPYNLSQLTPIFLDEFNSPAGTTPEGRWRYLTNGGTYVHDGNGRLVGTRAENPEWNSPGIESRGGSNSFFIPGDGRKDYLIEFRVTIPEHQMHWLGIGSNKALINYRGFETMPSVNGTNGVECGRLTFMLNQDPGFQNGWGLETDVVYDLNQPIGLLMWMRADGRLHWYYDSGSGYQPVTPTGNNASWQDIPAALSWNVGEGDTYWIKVDCNGAGSSTTPNLIIDRIAVYETDPWQGGSHYLLIY